MFSTVLVPLDGSDLAAGALPYAVFLARGTRARLILVHTVSRRALDRDPDSEIDTVLDHDRLAERLAEGGVPTTAQTIEGEAGPAIVRAVADLRANLVVMSTHVRGGMDWILHRSVADHVLQHVSVPILMVTVACRRAWVEGRPFRILIPLDGSALAEEAIGPALELARSFPVELWLLQAAEERVGIDALGFARREPPSDADLAAARVYLEKVAAPLRQAGHRVTVVVEPGRADEAIARVAEREAVDLAAMATRGHGGVRRLLLERMATVVTAGRVPLHVGSVAAASLRRLGVPILLVCPACIGQPVGTAASDAPPAGHAT